MTEERARDYGLPGDRRNLRDSDRLIGDVFEQFARPRERCRLGRELFCTKPSSRLLLVGRYRRVDVGDPIGHLFLRVVHVPSLSKVSSSGEFKLSIAPVRNVSYFRLGSRTARATGRREVQASAADPGLVQFDKEL